MSRFATTWWVVNPRFQEAKPRRNLHAQTRRLRSLGTLNMRFMFRVFALHLQTTYPRAKPVHGADLRLSGCGLSSCEAKAQQPQDRRIRSWDVVCCRCLLAVLLRLCILCRASKRGRAFEAGNTSLGDYVIIASCCVSTLQVFGLACLPTSCLRLPHRRTVGQVAGLPVATPPLPSPPAPSLRPLRPPRSSTRTTCAWPQGVLEPTIKKSADSRKRPCPSLCAGWLRSVAFVSLEHADSVQTLRLQFGSR